MKKMKIKYTTDYNIFENVIGNRNIDKRNKKRLNESMVAYNMQQPILVGPLRLNADGSFKYPLIDGMHRLVVAKELGIIVPYVISDITNENIIDELQISKRWTALDYCNKNAAKGSHTCIVALEICEKWYKETNGKFSIINGLTLLNDSYTVAIGNLLKKNTYKINIGVADRIYAALNILKQNQNKRFNPFSAANSRAFKRLDAKVGGLDYKKIKKITKTK